MSSSSVAYATATSEGTFRCEIGDVRCKVPQLPSSGDVVRGQVVSYLDSQFQTRVLSESSTYVHAVILSTLWGFPDDFAVQVGVRVPRCAPFDLV